VTWSIEIEPGGLVRPDPGPGRPQLKEALQDCVESLSPVGTEPSLSTYWIDQALAALSGSASTESVIASGNAWSLVRYGNGVAARFDYAAQGEEAPAETIPVEDLVRELTAYRDAVVQALDQGHKLDERWWAQRNPS
jgi:hypothetical protein